ncbi:serine hydrolase domain-containing protein [Aquimarina megaterium]|uniref:serine hydrolase domain-containing protein n=1 Tax=Aquimarina megaterium TaxID=1443666 RepID=UPI00094349BE|nr:serine hydrolase domain-containing protein [Aquimarina megaterium]
MKTSVFLFVLSCLFITLVSSCKNKQPITTVTLLENQLDSLYTNQFPNPDQPGGTVLIKKGDKTLFLKSYGVADMQTGEKNTEHTLFNTGSISKTFVANGILILQQRGLLSIEDAIAKYFNDFTNQEIANKIKIKHWLSHTSGIPDVRKVEQEREFYLTARDTQNFAPLKKVDSLYFEPGERFKYSNPVYNGLALIIDQVTGADWQKFIKKEILEPSGMNTTKIVQGSYPSDGVAHGYIYKEGKYQEQDYGEEPTYGASGNSGVYSSVIELTQYEKAIQDNVFLNKELTDQSRTVWKPYNWKSQKEPLIGYSWFIEKDTFLSEHNSPGITFIYHTGSNGGFNSFYITIPEKDILIIGLFNQPLKEYKKLVFSTIDIVKEHSWGE